MHAGACGSVLPKKRAVTEAVAAGSGLRGLRSVPGPQLEPRIAPKASVLPLFHCGKVQPILPGRLARVGQRETTKVWGARVVLLNPYVGERLLHQGAGVAVPLPKASDQVAAHHLEAAATGGRRMRCREASGQTARSNLQLRHVGVPLGINKLQGLAPGVDGEVPGAWADVQARRKAFAVLHATFCSTEGERGEGEGHATSSQGGLATRAPGMRCVCVYACVLALTTQEADNAGSRGEGARMDHFDHVAAEGNSVAAVAAVECQVENRGPCEPRSGGAGGTAA